MVSQPRQQDIDELMAVLGSAYPRDDVVVVARDLGMLPGQKPQAVLGEMVDHPQPLPVEVPKPVQAPVLEEAVAAAPVDNPNVIRFSRPIGPVPAPAATPSRWKRFTQGTKNFASGMSSYVQDKYQSVKAKLNKCREDAKAKYAVTPLWKKVAIATAATVALGAIGYACWPSKKDESAVIDEKTVFATLSYNGTDWAIPKDAAKQIGEFMDRSFAQGDTFQTIEAKLIAADFADKTKDNKIYAAGLKYLK